MKKKRVITLALGTQVSIPTYIKGIRVAKANPDEMFKRGLTTWWSTSGADIFRQYMDGVHDRINQAVKNRNILTHL